MTAIFRETPKKACDVLVSLGIIAYFLPYLMMFPAMIRLQREPAGPEVMRVPGGKPAAVLCGAVGFLTSAAAIVLAAIPPAGNPDVTPHGRATPRCAPRVPGPRGRPRP